ncbi:HlyD family type I secretion periplasmic adaptor subunit [Bradyrhizobium elkanii]|uniref:HlyD family type I secretion periplasmic adaptor subunit n=1 Tax=Bradyrhizobium elkanii TaxID=29448 RepID=UPI003D1EFF0B
MKTPETLLRSSIRRNLIVGFLLVLLLIIGIGSWATTTEIWGAVVANGSVVVESNVKKIQHPTGGVIGQILVREGDRVKAGGLLIRLDEVQAKANLAIVSKNLDELRVRRARLEAERDEEETIVMPLDLSTRASDATLTRVINGETKLFVLRRSAREGQKGQLRERIAELNEEISGTEFQAHAKAKESEILGRELEGIRDLWGKKLIPITRVTMNERDAARLEGERGALLSRLAETKRKITETNLQIIQIDQDLRSEVARELADIRGKMSEFEEKEIVAQDQLRRIDIRSPQDGIVYQISVHTIGGVVNSGEVLMLIAPEADKLSIDVKVAPQDIDQLSVSQTAAVRFLAFNQRSTPELNGIVQRISPDLIEDDRNKSNYYLVRVELGESEVHRLGDLKLLPGMPVEAFIRTNSRTMLSYLVRPIADQISKAFREK